MSHFIGSDKNRTLIKKNGTEVSVHNGAIIKYIANYYTKNLVTCRYDHQEVPFIGHIISGRIVDSINVGIFIRPLYIYLNEEWMRIINYKDPIYRSYFLYPHLLGLHKESSYRSILQSDSISSAIISDYDSPDMKQLDLEYPD
jgi:hypothetical protein